MPFLNLVHYTGYTLCANQHEKEITKKWQTRNNHESITIYYHSSSKFWWTSHTTRKIPFMFCQRIAQSKDQWWKARYTLFANNDEKGTNGRSPCETWIVCREWFVRFVSILWKSFLQNSFTGIGGFLTNSKNFFLCIFHCYTHSWKLGSMANSV